MSLTSLGNNATNPSNLTRSTRQMNFVAPPIPSPCTGICRADDATGYCLGCGRSKTEIGEWLGATNSRRREIWSLLPPRFAELKIDITRLPWSQQDIVSFARKTLQERQGAWVMGCYGAAAEFMAAGDEACDISTQGETISAISSAAAIRLNITERIRALQLRDDRAPGGYRAIFLVMPTPKTLPPAATSLTALGPDGAALREGERNNLLYDFGLGRGGMRFCLRTNNAHLTATLDKTLGCSLPQILSACGSALLQVSPVRVVETLVGRIEVGTPIPRPGERSPDGPHTHLLPDHLAMQRATDPTIQIPPAYTLCATFHPRLSGPDGANPPALSV